MKKGRIFGAFLIILALIIVGLPVPVADAKGESSFTISSHTLKSYVGTETTVSVPDGVETIGRDAFKNNLTVEKVVLPSSVTKIEPYAFWGCENLKEISLSSGVVNIGDYAFANCTGLENMTLPYGTRSIGIYSFEDCVNMTDITIPYTVTDIHETSFDGCKRLVIHAEEGSYPYKYAQNFYKRQSEMPEYEDVDDYDTTTVSPIDDAVNETIESTEDTSGSLLGSVHVVQNSAVVFMDNKSGTVYEGAPKQEQTEEPVNKYGYDELFSEIMDAGNQKYTIVDGMVIADQAYYRSDALTKEYIPDSVTEIGEFSFARSSLQEVALGSNVKTIGYGAFYHCDYLSKVILSDSIVCVEPKAFEQTKWVNDFMTGNSTSDYLISGGVLVAYKGNSSAVDIPKGVRVIAAGCFTNHSEICSVRFPDTLQTIGEEAFYGCSSLSTVMYGGQENAIKDRAFEKTAISFTQLPSSLTELGKEAFPASTQVLRENSVKDTVENSARRLSNYSYRGTGALGQGSVTTQGLPGVTASLSGAKDSYLLSIANASVDSFALAFQRNLSSLVPEGAVAYQLALTDSSGIAINRLGKQYLKVVLPSTYDLMASKLKAVILDANGQLEEVTIQKVQDGNGNYLVVEMSFVSKLCIYPVEGQDGTDTFEENEEMMQLSEPRQVLAAAGNENDFPWRLVKWITGGTTLLAGFYFLLRKS